MVQGEKRPISVVAPWSTRVEAGACLALTGPFDSGPRSALRLVAQLDSRSSGTVELVGDRGVLEPSEADWAAFRRRVLYLPAFAQLILCAPRKFWSVLRSEHRVAVRTWNPPADENEAAVLALEIAADLRPGAVLVDTGALIRSDVLRRRWVDAVRSVLLSGSCALLVGQDERLLASVANRVEVWLDGRVVGEGTPETLLGAAHDEARLREPR